MCACRLWWLSVSTFEAASPAAEPRAARRPTNHVGKNLDAVHQVHIQHAARRVQMLRNCGKAEYNGAQAIYAQQPKADQQLHQASTRTYLHKHLETALGIANKLHTLEYLTVHDTDLRVRARRLCQLKKFVCGLGAGAGLQKTLTKLN